MSSSGEHDDKKQPPHPVEAIHGSLVRGRPGKPGRASPRRVHLSPVLSDPASDRGDQLASAVRSRRSLLTLKLLRRGADPNSRVAPVGETEADDDGEAAPLRPGRNHDSVGLARPRPLLGEERLLQQAVRDGSEPLVRMLLEHGADINAADSAGCTALHTAVTRPGGDAVLRLLLSVPALNIEARDRGGRSALHCAAAAGRSSRVTLLLDGGASVAVRDSRGLTPLMEIVRKCPECLEAAFDRGLELVEPGGPADKRVVLDYSVFDPRLLELQSWNDLNYHETCLLNSIDNDRVRKRLFLHPLCQTFLNLKWGIVWPFYLLHTLIFALFVICFNVFVVSTLQVPHSATWDVLELSMMVVTPLTIVALLLRELHRVVVIGGRAYLQASENLVVWCCCLAAAICLSTAYVSPVLCRQVGAATLLVSWSELLYLLGLAEFASIMVMTLVTLVRTLTLFLMVYILIVIAFASCFLVLFRDQINFGSTLETFLTTIVMSVGELNYDPANLRGSGFGYVAYILFIFTVLIITMNAMIGLAVNDTRHIERRASLRLHTKHLEYVHVFERHLTGVWKRLWRHLPRSDVSLLTKLSLGRIEVPLSSQRLGGRLLTRVVSAIRRVPAGESERAKLTRWLQARPQLLVAAAGVVISRRRREAEIVPLRISEPAAEPEPHQEEESELEEVRRTTLELKCDVDALKSEISNVNRNVQLVLEMLDQAKEKDQ